MPASSDASKRPDLMRTPEETIGGFSLGVKVGGSKPGASTKPADTGFSSKAGTADPVPFDSAKLERIQRNLGKELEIKFDPAFLERYGNEAMFFPGGYGKPSTILLKPNPSRAAVVEELTHFGQWRRAEQAGMTAKEFTAGLVQTEIRAHEKLLPLKIWTPAERAGIEENLKYWQGRQ
jgi:hypothetical protein